MKRDYSEEITEGRELVLADFPNQITSLPKWHWRSFADTVMGGKSYLVPPEIVGTPEGYALLLSGQVVTAGGGFIQIRLQREKKVEQAADFLSEQEYNKQYGREDGVFMLHNLRALKLILKQQPRAAILYLCEPGIIFFPGVITLHQLTYLSSAEASAYLGLFSAVKALFESLYVRDS